MPTALLADWFQQPYVRVEIKRSNFLLGFLIITRKCLDNCAWERKFCATSWVVTFSGFILQNLMDFSYATERRILKRFLLWSVKARCLGKCHVDMGSILCKMLWNNCKLDSNGQKLKQKLFKRGEFCKRPTFRQKRVKSRKRWDIFCNQWLFPPKII